MPTGGKSVCFQIPALIRENLTIVVSPLIALMKDQMDNLTKRIYTAFFVNSSISENTKEKDYRLSRKEKSKIIVPCPRKLKIRKNSRSAKKN